MKFDHSAPPYLHDIFYEYSLSSTKYRKFSLTTGGLSSIMGLISGKKPKLGTLDKSKMDWNTFVEQEGIKEELQTHNKGKDGLVNFIF